MSTFIEGSPLRAMRAARTASYPNSDAERRTIRAVDKAVAEQVRPVEQVAIRQAAALRERGREADQAAHAALAEIRALEDEARRGGRVDAAFAKRYERARADADLALATLHRIDRDAERLAITLSDPRQRVEDLLDKFIGLRGRVSTVDTDE
jgi:hypothetical protein